jgi:catechol 2,3-dioxygenase-like lactoylglutathione lyase family enzyme
MQNPGVHHIGLRVHDCERSALFYEQAFGLREIKRVESERTLRAVWLQADGIVLMLELSLRGTGSAVGSGHLLIFAASDLAAAEQRFASLGIEVNDRTGSTLYVTDPDGHRAGVSTFRFAETARDSVTGQS